MSPIPSATTEVTVMITDLNDEPPVFRSQQYKCEIAENAPINTPLTCIGDTLSEVYDYDQVMLFPLSMFKCNSITF